MIKCFIFCNNPSCNTNITERIENHDDGWEYLQKNMITINGRIHFCDESCKEDTQKDCEEMTGHRNSVKDQVQGECLDCGKHYELSGL